MPVTEREAVLSVTLQVSGIPFEVLPFSVGLRKVGRANISSNYIVTTPPFSCLSRLQGTRERYQVLYPRLPNYRGCPSAHLPTNIRYPTGSKATKGRQFTFHGRSCLREPMPHLLRVGARPSKYNEWPRTCPSQGIGASNEQLFQ